MYANTINLEDPLSPESLQIHNDLEVLLEGPLYTQDEPIELEHSEVKYDVMFTAF